MTFEQWLAFVAFWTLATLPIGPNAVACISAGVRHGFRRAWMVPLGITVASLLHMAVTGLGLGVLLMSSAALFTAVKVAGVLYLLWLALQLWRSPAELRRPGMAPRVTHLALLRDGTLVSLSNPKAVLMYVAVFPQFIDPAQALLPQLAILVPSAAGIVLAVYSGYGLLGMPLGRWLASARRLRLFNRAAAGLYGATAVALAFSDNKVR